MQDCRRVRLIEPKPPGLNVFSGTLLPRLGLPIMGTILARQGFDVRIYCQEIEQIDYEDLYASEVVGISTTTSTAPLAYALADDLTKRGIPTVIGGSHATFEPEEALEHATYCVRGEAEISFPELVRCILDKDEPSSIDGVSYVHDGDIRHNPEGKPIEDLDSLPFPDISLIHGVDKIKIRPVLTSRGCPFDCTFCSVTQMFGHKYRVRSVENVLEELRIARPKQIFFYDDNFAANRRRTMELCEGMLKYGVNTKWGAQVRVDIANDPELLSLMRKSGCDMLYIGLESVNPETLRAFNKRQDVEDIERCIRVLHEHGILIHGMFIAGADSDDIQTVKSTADFALSNEIDTLQISLLTPFPGTSLYEEMVEQDRILLKDWSLYDGHHVVFRPKNMSPYDLQQASIWANRKFYSLSRCMYDLARGKFTNALLRGYGGYQTRRWTKENQDFIAMLNTRAS